MCTNTEQTKIDRERERFLHERNTANTELRGAGSLWGPLWPCGIEEEMVGLARWRGAVQLKPPHTLA